MQLGPYGFTPRNKSFRQAHSSLAPSIPKPNIAGRHRAWLTIATAALALAPFALAQAQLLKPAYKFASPVTIGTPAVSGTVTVTFSAPGTLSKVSVLTQGVASQDFTVAAGGSCSLGTSYFAAQTCTVAVSFQPKYPGLRQGAVVLQANGGSVLGTELLNGSALGPTAIFLPGMISTVAGNGQWIYRGDGGLATASPLFLPMGGAADAAGNLYLSDSNNQRIRFVNASTGIISTLAGNGTTGFAGDGGPATSAMFNTPADVKIDGAGNYYIADSANQAVRFVNTSTGIIQTVAGVGGVSGYSGDGGPASAAHLNFPSAIAFDGDHSLYISDTGNNAVRKVDLTTGIITTVAGTGTAGFAGDGGPAVSGELNYPWGIALGGDGSLYIADLSNNRVRKVDPTGTLSTVIGTGVRGYSGDGGLATQAQLNVPAGVVMDVAGNLYVADSGNQFVRKVGAVTGIIQTIAGTLSATPTGDGGPATNTVLDGPYALFLDGPGDLYIADMFHQLIRMVSSNLATLTYPVMQVGKISVPQPEAIENDGNATLTFSAFNLVSNSALDPATTTCLLSQTESPDQSCTFGVEFAPTVIGNPVTGSVSIASNAANAPSVIDLSGQVLLTQPTTAVLTSSANPAALGAAVTFTVVVSNSQPTPPTGTVNFFDGSTQIGSATLSATAVATFSTSTLTLGSHTIKAVYVGDSNNASATSPSLVQHIEQPTNTVLTSSPNPSVGATPVTFSATVTGPNGSTTPPTGSVTFSDGATALGQGALNASGIATFTVSTLAGGQHNITAAYNGDSNNLPSQSPILVQTVAKATTTTSLSTSNPTVAVGISVTFTASVSRSDGVVPTGTVSFLDGAMAIATSPLNASGVATFATSSLAGGTHTITAVYNGDSYSNTSTSSPVTQTIQQIATTTAATASANPATAGAPVILTATVAASGGSGSGGTFSGTVTFQNGATTLGTSNVSAAGVATLSVSTLGLGAQSIVATYAGNTNYSGSASAPLIVNVISATTTTTVASSQTPSIAGKPVILTATVTGSGGVPTGTVTFMSGATVLGTGTLNISGIATFTSSNLPVGSLPITAVYAGDSKDNSSSSTALLQIVQIATSTTNLGSSSNPSAFGSSITFTATVTTNGGTATGTVTFADGATTLGSAALNAGVAVFTTSTLALGTHPITASYAGDPSDTPSQSGTLAQQVLQASAVTLTSRANPSVAGTSVTFTATVAAPQGVALTGSVTFKDGATVLGTGNITGGIATFSTSALAVGAHSIVAAYSGDSNNQPASSFALMQTVQVAGTTVTLISSANPSLANAPLTLTSTVLGTGGTVTGSITFKDGTTVLGSANLTASGSATFLLPGLTPGSHSLVAVYSGDANNQPSTSAVLTQNVNQTTTVALTSSQNPSLALGPVTFTATVSNGSASFPSGSVVFSDTFNGATSVLGTVTLNAIGVATFTAPSLPTGQHTISAAYGGDTLNIASTATPLAQSVQLRPTTDTLTASSTSLTGGQQVTLISVVRFNGPITPTGTVTFTSNGTTLGTVPVDTTGVATLAVNLLTTAPAMIASYSGDSVYASSVSTQTDITVAQPSDFTLQLSPPAVTLQSKQNSTVTLTITSVNSFTDTLDLGCLGLPFATTCTFNKDTVGLTGNGVQTVTLVVDTGSPLTAGSVARLQQPRSSSLATLCFLPGGLLAGLFLFKGRRRMRSRLTGLLMLLILAGLSIGLSGCSGLQINGTPAGKYVFQVTATGTGTGVSQSTDVTLTVTQ